MPAGGQAAGRQHVPRREGLAGQPDAAERFDGAAAGPPARRDRHAGPVTIHRQAKGGRFDPAAITSRLAVIRLDSRSLRGYRKSLRPGPAPATNNEHSS